MLERLSDISVSIWLNGRVSNTRHHTDQRLGDREIGLHAHFDVQRLCRDRDLDWDAVLLTFRALFEQNKSGIFIAQVRQLHLAHRGKSH